MGEIAEKAKKFTCPALRKAIEDREISGVMSRELMATVRNNDSIPESKRFPMVDALINVEKKDKAIEHELIQIEQNIGCRIPEEKICGTPKERFVKMQREMYKATFNKDVSDEFIKRSIDNAKYMCIVSKHKSDPRVMGNR